MNPPAKPIMTTATIEDLPPEMICELFHYLCPKDLVTCSMVNKRWHSIYAGIKLHRLIAINCYYGISSSNWFDSDQIREREAVSPAMFRRLAEKPQLSNLKHLALSGRFEFDLNKLNCFQQLVQLEINLKDLPEAHLNLPQLKVLAFHRLYLTCDLSIDCPLLSTLVYRGYYSNQFKVKQPETIRKLVTNISNPSCLAVFKNVECLVTKEFQVINKATILSLPRLKELHYNRDIKRLFDDSPFEIVTVDEVKRMLGELLDEARLRGNDFRFRFAGLLLANVDVDQIDFGVEVEPVTRRERVSNNEYVYMKNYHLIEPGAMHWVYDVDYTRLLSYVTGEFPRCFSQKFTGIYCVDATAKVRDADHFLWFLKSLRFLLRLELEATGLSQEFYDQLPASAPSLRRLYLREGHCKDELQLNIDFIDELSRLTHVWIKPALSLESIPSLFRSADRLKEGDFRFESRTARFSIWKKEASTDWRIYKNSQFVLENEDPEEIVNFFEGRQDKTPESLASLSVLDLASLSFD